MGEKVRGWLTGLVKLPWWVSMILSAGVYAALAWVVPVINEGQSLLRPLTPVVERLAPAAAFLMLLAAAVSVYRQLCKGWRAGAAAGEDPRRRQFEDLVSEAFRRKGFMVLNDLEDGPSRGADIWLRKKGQVAFVHCRHWKDETVGADAVRELRRIMKAESVKHGVIVTCGGFTLDAMELAATSSIELIDGPRLAQLMDSVEQGGGLQARQPSGRTRPAAPTAWQHGLRGRVPMRGSNSRAVLPVPTAQAWFPQETD